MLKTIGAISIIFCGTMTGLSFSKNLLNRVEFLESFLKFIVFAENEIQYSISSISDILIKFSDNGIFKKFLSICKDNFSCENSFYYSWVFAIDQISKKYCVSKNDVTLIKSFGQNFGTSDIESQISHCELHKKLVSDELSLAKESQKKQSKLYLTLGICGSLTLVLILI